MKKNLLVLAFLNSLVSFVFAQEINAPSYIEEEEEVESPMCGGTERWSIKVLTDAQASSVNFTPIISTVANLVAINTPFPNPNMPRQTGIEDKTYEITCNITIKKVETDDDYHLVLSDGVHTMIGEIPNPVCAAAASSSHHAQYLAARNFVDANIPSGNVFNVNIGMVTVTGVAFVDPPHGQTGAAPNNLELHPIIDIHFPMTTGEIEKEKRNLKVEVGPNPFSESTSFNIISKTNNLKNCSLTIYNMFGEEIKKLPLDVINSNQIKYTLNKDNLSAGTYIYRIRNEEYPLYEGKLIVE